MNPLKAKGADWIYERKPVTGKNYGEPGYFRGQADNSRPASGRGAYPGDAGGRRFAGNYPQRYAWLEPEDIPACLLYARKVIGREWIELAAGESGG